MSYNRDEPSRNITYDALPLTSAVHPSDSLHIAPSPSPEPPSLSYHTPQLDSRELPDVPPSDSNFLGTALYDTSSQPRSLHPSEDPGSRPLLGQEDAFPSDTAPPQPRFLGAAFYDQNGAPRSRYSVASQGTAPSIAGDSEFNSSVYALNDARAYGSSYFDDQQSYRDDPRDGYSHPVPIRSSPTRSRYLEEKRTAYASPRTVSKRKVLLVIIPLATIVIIAAVAIPIYFLVIKPKSRTSSSQHQHPPTASQTTGPGRPSTLAVTGGDGSTVTMDDGTTFIYHNSFGGYWYFDENDPFNNGARPQSWSPALNETFSYGSDRIRGSVYSAVRQLKILMCHCSVNLGGWLNTEPVSFVLLHFPNPANS